MNLHGTRTFVGFGFGPIQAGLFLYEAMRSGGFIRLVVAEILPELVNAVRTAQNSYFVNIAHSDRIERAPIGPIEIECPMVEADRRRLVQALAEAQEIATAVPSVQHYTAAGPASLHRLLAEGLRLKLKSNGPRAIIYAAENHNHAAEILQAAVREEIPRAEQEAAGARVRYLNTVIGKMSGVISDPDEMRSQALAPIAPGLPRAFLVEAFNRILISRIRFGVEPGFERGITVFAEKDDLLPFEEAKLYGHNATHALAAYVSAIRGIARVAELRRFPEILEFLLAAFTRESGEALIRKNAGVDELFTPEGYRLYAEDLLARMTNPFLRDTVERVGRDPKRKLGWDDRLIGTMRVALKAGVRPRRYALGAAAALAVLDPSSLGDSAPLAPRLERLWSGTAPDGAEKEAIFSLVEEGRRRLRKWRDLGYPPPEPLLAEDASGSAGG